MSPHRPKTTPFHVACVWLDEGAMRAAGDRQRGRHLRDIHMRRVPARVDAIDYGKFGCATITVTLFGGMDPSLYADFKPGSSVRMAAAEDTLRTWWPNHDGMNGKIVAVEKSTEPESLASSGVQVKFQVELVLEGFRPGRTIRLGSLSRPDVKPPVEELIRNFEDRWPSPDIFDH